MLGFRGKALGFRLSGFRVLGSRAWDSGAGRVMPPEIRVTSMEV